MNDLISELKATLEDAFHTLMSDPVFSTIFLGTASREVYLAFLSETYHYIYQTPITLRMGAEALAGHPNPMYQAIREKFVGHEAEETGHDEWVLSDIRALGGDPEAVRRAEPNPAVKAYLAEARFVATSRHPVGIFGEAFLLEGLAQQLGSSTARNLKEKSGIPGIENAVQFLEGHGELDQGHMEQLQQILRAITDPADQRAIALRARSAAHQYTHLLHYSFRAPAPGG